MNASTQYVVDAVKRAMEVGESMVDVDWKEVGRQLRRTATHVTKNSDSEDAPELDN